MSDYLLGHDPREWSRLEEQHALWRHTLLGVLDRLGVGQGDRVLEVGCGPGFLLADLASRVGPGGRCVGLERDPAAAEGARARTGVPVVVGDLHEVPVEGPFDAVVARWVFSFLADPGGAAARLRDLLAPGGFLVVQDYHHDGMRLYPDRVEVMRAIEAFRAAYRARGGDLYVAGKLPAHFHAAGLAVEAIEPVAVAGRPGSAAFRWVERFLHEHLGGVVAGGFLSPEEADGFRAAWAEARAAPGATLFSPMQVTVVGRR